jgi:hypothetical protein
MPSWYGVRSGVSSRKVRLARNSVLRDPSLLNIRFYDNNVSRRAAALTGLRFVGSRESDPSYEVLEPCLAA